MKIIDQALNRSRMVLSLLIFIWIAGIFAYVAIPKEADPDINIPIIYTTISLDGVSPEDSERLLIRPLEKELTSIEGVKEMRANAYEGGGSVILEFDAGFDADTAIDDVREAVDKAKPNLPGEADEPEVHEVNLSLFPILVVTVSGDMTARSLLHHAQDLQEVLEEIPEVLEVDLVGEREEVLEVIVEPSKLESYKISPTELAAKLRADNILVAAGALDTGAGRFTIKVPGLFENALDVGNVPLIVNDEAIVRFSDIADVKRTFKDPTTFARMNGRPALVLEVSKRTGANIIDTVEKVKQVATAVQSGWPQSINVTFSQDKSTQILTMLTDLQNNVISAILLVMILVVATLGLRGGLLVGLSIPGSFLTGILLLYAAGMTVNVVVLFGLILAVGMLVDGAIVVSEFADRKMAEGANPDQAYGLAAKRMSWPIIASTSTTLAAFLPLLFWPDIVGEFMKFLPITLIATLSASLVMALIFLPVLGTNIVTMVRIFLCLFIAALAAFMAKQFGLPGFAVALGGLGGLAAGVAIAIFAKQKIINILSQQQAGQPDDISAKLSGSSDHVLTADELKNLSGFTGFYVRVLDKALGHPAKVFGGAVFVLIASWGLYIAFGHGVEFFPKTEPDQLRVDIHARGNLAVNERDQLVRSVEQKILEVGQSQTMFKSVYASSGLFSTRSEEVEDIIGKIRIELEDWRKRPTAEVIKAEIRKRVEPIRGIQVEVREPSNGPRQDKPFLLKLSSPNSGDLLPAISAIRNLMDGMDGFFNVEDSRSVPGIEWKLDVDRQQAAKFNADIGTLGGFVQLVTKGIVIDSYRPDDADEEIDIVLRLPEAYRTLDQLDNIRLNIDDQVVPVGNFLTREPIQRTGIIRRTDGERTMFIKSDLAEGVLLGDQIAKLNAAMEQLNLPPRIRMVYKGDQESQDNSQAFLMKAFAVALFMIAVILVTQFNSFYSTLLILSAIIMSTIGVMLGLLVINQPFGIVMSGIGVIALAGIVVNNNIVLIDTFDRLRADHGDDRLAIMLTGAQRLRPVLLTTTTTILGLLPLTAQISIDFAAREVTHGAPSTQWWQQLSTAIVFGLGFATILTLIVTPCLLMVRTNVKAYMARRHKPDITAPSPAE